MTPALKQTFGKSALARTGLAPRGLNREQAAEYIGVGPTKFDELVRDGRMPRPKEIDGRRVWDLEQVDRCFERLPGGAGNSDEWDDVRT